MNADFEQKATKGTKVNRGFREWANDGDDDLFRGLRRAWEYDGAGGRGAAPGGQLENPCFT
jgi:hypothetical protein